MTDPVKTASLVIPGLALLLQFAQWLLPKPDGEASPFKGISKSRKWTIVVTSLIILASFTYYSVRNIFPSELSASPVDRIRAKGELVVGVMYDSPPFSYKPSDTDAVRGFEADIGREIAKKSSGTRRRLGSSRPKVEKRFSRDYLEKNGVDIVISTVSVNYEKDNRSKTMAFQIPTTSLAKGFCPGEIPVSIIRPNFKGKRSV